MSAVGSNQTGAPGVVERGFEISQHPVGGGAPPPHRIRILAVEGGEVRLGARTGAPPAWPLRDRAVPVGEPLGGDPIAAAPTRRAKPRKF
jgi:hypothetical protein